MRRRSSLSVVSGVCRGARYVARRCARAVRSTRRGRCSRPAAPDRSSARRRTRPWPPATALRWPHCAGARVRRPRVRPVSSDGSASGRRAAVPAVRGAARRGRAAGQRSRRTVHGAVRAGRRPCVARSRGARDRQGDGPHRCPGLPDDGAPRRIVRRGRGFPTIAAACAQAGLDLATDRIPVSPAAHYVMGGVETDLDGRTSIDAPLRRGRGRLHRCPRREPPREQLAARRARVRCASGRGHDGRMSLRSPPRLGGRRLADSGGTRWRRPSSQSR